MTKVLYQQGEFDVWLCRADRQVRYQYPTHRVTDNGTEPIAWTGDTLHEFLKSVQQKRFSRPLQADRWYWRIKRKSERNENARRETDSQEG